MSVIENVAPGRILCLSIMFPHQETPENKYVVVVKIGANPALMKINSLKRDSTDLTLKKVDYPFFRNEESYLHCGSVWFNLITVEEVIKQLTDDSKRVKGKLKDDHIRELMVRVDKSKELERGRKREIIEALKNSLT